MSHVTNFSADDFISRLSDVLLWPGARGLFSMLTFS